MRFSWKSFCEAHRIEHDPGKNDIQVRCPFADCTSTSGKKHMGLSLHVLAPAWHCWKCNRGGTRPEYLVRALIGVSRDRAEEIVREHQGTTGVDEFDSLFELPAQQQRTKRTSVIFPRTVHPLFPARSNGGMAFIDYLSRVRGFGADADEVSKQYGLHFAVTGMFAQRLVFPVLAAGKLVSYTGRTLAKVYPPYLTAPGTYIKDYVAGWDMLNRLQHGPRTLLIAEGPVDWLKLDYYGAAHGVRATCTFGTAYTLHQVNLLRMLLDKWFERAVVVYDRGAELMGGQLAEDLRMATNKKVSTKAVGMLYGKNVKDPGDLSPSQVVEFVHRVVEET